MDNIAVSIERMTPQRKLAGRAPAALMGIAFALLASGCGKEPAVAAANPSAAPPKTVSVIQMTPESVRISTEWIATLDGLVNAQIRPQVSGYLVRATYREGAAVNKGDVLFEIDPRTFEAALAQAEAQLGQAKAQLGRTELDVARDKPMAAERAIAQSQLDNDVQLNLAAQAAVKSAEASVATARLNLEFTKVRSLVGGVAAIATAQIGDLVGPTTLLTTVSQVNPIRVYFSLNEPEYLQIAAQINARTPTKSLWGNGTALTLTLADGSVYPEKGTFLAADRQIDPKTGTIRISATFPNPNNQLRPGQYGRVSAETKVAKEALLVPLRAVSELQGTFQVRVAAPDNTVEIRNVTLGDRIDSRYIVEKGLAAGDKVIVDSGAVAAGAKVVTKPYAPQDAAVASASATPAGK
ncbi:MAG: efflux RND transporter periplasmic adaptor subunit [Vicinamibacteria bacterium]